MSATPVLASVPEIQPASRQKCHHATRSTAHAEAIAGYVLAAPAFLLIGFLILLPLLAVLGVAVTDWEFGARSFNFVGARAEARFEPSTGRRISAQRRITAALTFTA
jgi:ABC-type sugar transport system permease subunit